MLPIFLLLQTFSALMYHFILFFYFQELFGVKQVRFKAAGCGGFLPI